MWHKYTMHIHMTHLQCIRPSKKKNKNKCFLSGFSYFIIIIIIAIWMLSLQIIIALLQG